MNLVQTKPRQLRCIRRCQSSEGVIVRQRRLVTVLGSSGIWGGGGKVCLFYIVDTVFLFYFILSARKVSPIFSFDKFHSCMDHSLHYRHSLYLY